MTSAFVASTLDGTRSPCLRPPHSALTASQLRQRVLELSPVQRCKHRIPVHSGRVEWGTNSGVLGDNVSKCALQHRCVIVVHRVTRV